MADRGAARGGAVLPASQPGVLRRLAELLMMLVSAVLVLFAWERAGRAEEEAGRLRAELRRAKGEQAGLAGTQCVVCLDTAREVLLQPCGHVCACRDCVDRSDQCGCGRNPRIPNMLHCNEIMLNVAGAKTFS